MVMIVTKLEAKIEAISLRSAGFSYNQIAEKLGVSKGTIHAWLKGCINEEENSDIRLGLQCRASKIKGEKASRLARKKREEWQNNGKITARAKTSMHVAGCMLYWAEGGKHRNQLSFVNGDVNMVKTFVRFLRECYGEYIQSMTLRINFYSGNGLTQEEIENFWLQELQLDRTSLRKSIVDYFPSEKHGKKKGKLLYGVARIEVSNTELLHNIYGAIQEYGNFQYDLWNYGALG